ncbi:nuclear transport factor 2 family protein [Dyadobacter sandarakinus]|uniref:Nuclear transport factor 2 family protein n=1 Tax=Dyadobacter sandarakinus TaxID=2747268 RepID=A0ABX7IBP1_9BACT|nr:nuclear transport factor 2 family protein [Dyadobacter sandarakinus]QRR03133.1 nuclear transport factor 2 family protein [Dyadobacter sandarakinus]
MNYLFTILTILFLVSSPDLHAQNAETDIRHVVDKLFDGMRRGDSSMVSNVFAAGATLQSISADKPGQAALHAESVDAFIKAVGTPHAKQWDERIYNVKLLTDGPMAVVWAPYKFYLGGTFSHCGVNVFTLLQNGNQWKITGITDTRRKDNCQ